MLNIRQVRHLADVLDTTPKELREVLQTPREFYQELVLKHPQKPDKARIVVDVRGLLRAFQLRLYRRLLLPKLNPSVHSHGGVIGHHIKTNAAPHLGSSFVFTTDISDFYPSIHYKRVYQLFAERLGCSPDVARCCTQICTYEHHLALGLITSPILADQLMNRVDRRIGTLCKKSNLTYTRFVDDISISGPFDLERSGFATLVEKILTQDGFKVNPLKHRFGKFSKDATITSLREVRGHLDVKKEYLTELVRQLSDAASLARDEEFVGPYYTPGQLLGRVRFVAWVNPGRRKELMRRFRSIRWGLVKANAAKRSLVASRITVNKPSSEQ